MQAVKRVVYGAYGILGNITNMNTQVASATEEQTEVVAKINSNLVRTLRFHSRIQPEPHSRSALFPSGQNVQ